NRSFDSSSLLLIAGGLHADELQCLVELLQIIDEEMRPGPINRLFLADDPLFKVKPALSPPENFGHRRFAFERTKQRVTHRPLLQINLAVAASRFERQATASLA